MYPKGLRGLSWSCLVPSDTSTVSTPGLIARASTRAPGKAHLLAFSSMIFRISARMAPISPFAAPP